jgi:hypothetical protein
MKYKEPTTQDIIDHLKEQETSGSGFSSPEELEAAVQRELEPFDVSQVSEHEKAILEGRPVIEEEEKIEADTPVPQEFIMPSTSDDLDFMMEFGELGKVEVEDMERDLYMKSLLNDTTFQLPVEVFPGFKITVRSRNVFYDDLIYDMVRTISEKGEILGLESGFTKLMRFLAGVQVVDIQGRNVEFDPPAGLSRKEVAARLMTHVQEVYNSFSLAKWNAIVKGVRIFDSKQKICNDRLLDRTFWEGASIS